MPQSPKEIGLDLLMVIHKTFSMLFVQCPSLVLPVKEKVKNLTPGQDWPVTDVKYFHCTQRVMYFWIMTT